MLSTGEFLDLVPASLREDVKAALYGHDGRTAAGSQRQAALSVLNDRFGEKLVGDLKDLAKLARLADEDLFACGVDILASSIPRAKTRQRRRRKDRGFGDGI